jgi:hypothetical protein
MLMKQGKFDKNVSAINMQAKQLMSNIYLARPEAKEYFAGRLKDNINFLNSNVGVDLTNNATAGAYMQHVSSAVDEKIINEHQASLAKQSIDMTADEARKKGLYDDINYAYSTNDWNKWTTTEVGTKYTGRNQYVPFEDLTKNANEIVKNIDPEASVTVNSDGSYSFVKTSKSVKLANRIYGELNNYLNTSKATSQISVNGWNTYKDYTTDELKEGFGTWINGQKEMHSKNIKQYAQYADLADKQGDSVLANAYRESIQVYANKLKDLDGADLELRNIDKEKNPEPIMSRWGTFMYKNNFENNILLGSSSVSVKDVDIKENKANLEIAKMTQKENQFQQEFEYKANQDLIENQKTAAELEAKSPGAGLTFLQAIGQAPTPGGLYNPQNGDTYVPNPIKTEDTDEIYEKTANGYISQLHRGEEDTNNMLRALKIEPTIPAINSGASITKIKSAINEHIEKLEELLAKQPKESGVALSIQDTKNALVEQRDRMENYEVAVKNARKVVEQTAGKPKTQSEFESDSYKSDPMMGDVRGNTGDADGYKKYLESFAKHRDIELKKSLGKILTNSKSNPSTPAVQLAGNTNDIGIVKILIDQGSINPSDYGGEDIDKKKEGWQARFAQEFIKTYKPAIAQSGTNKYSLIIGGEEKADLSSNVEVKNKIDVAIANTKNTREGFQKTALILNDPNKFKLAQQAGGYYTGYSKVLSRNNKSVLAKLYLNTKESNGKKMFKYNVKWYEAGPDGTMNREITDPSFYNNFLKNSDTNTWNTMDDMDKFNSNATFDFAQFNNLGASPPTF